MPYRTTYFDPDYRKTPKTKWACYRCSKDLKPGQPHRFIAHELDTMDAIHGEDWEIARSEIMARRTHKTPFVVGPVGMDCARKIGMEYTRATDDIDWLGRTD